MNRIHYAFLAGCSALALAGCGADDVVAPNGNIIVNPTPTPTPTSTPTSAPGTVTAAPASDCTPGTTAGSVITLQGTRGTIRECIIPTNVTGTLALTKQRSDGIMYALNGRTDVGTDIDTGGTAANLNVSPGVTIFAKTRESSLIVNRGSKLNANGTEALPIIFTAEANLTGSVSLPGGGTQALTDSSDNLWGGIILNGRAPISDCDASVSSSSTGGTAGCWRKAEGTSTDVLYGGGVANDSSGSMQYVQVNFTGVGSNASEIQGITTGGVGSGTTMSFIQIHNSRDDGIEAFGGRQSMDHLIMTGVSDDPLDTDFGYQGRVQFLLVVRRANGTNGDDPDGETVFEIDSSGNPTATPQQILQVANFTVIQNTPNEPVMRIRGGADVSMYNGVVVGKVTGTGTGCLDVDNNETVTATRPLFRSVVFDCETLIHPDGDTLEAQALAVSGNTVTQNFVSSLLFLDGSSVGRIANGTNEGTITAAALPSGFQTASYIGALSGPSDPWTRNWTCNSDVANLGGANSCLDIRVS